MHVNIGFSSVHVFLAINAWTGEVVVGIFRRPNSESLKYFLRYFKRRLVVGGSTWLWIIILLTKPRVRLRFVVGRAFIPYLLLPTRLSLT